MSAISIGTPGSASAMRLLLLGSGELGKEVAIEAARLGVEVIAADRYAGAPAMQVAHSAHVLDMLDPQALKALLNTVKPTFVVPEIEAIHTPTLMELEARGMRVIPTARAAWLTMDREGIRRLAAETLGLPTSPYRFVTTESGYRAAIAAIGFPCVVKPVMSSSGKGQSVVRSDADVDGAWAESQRAGRAGAGRIIVEGFIEFDYEITLLTVRHAGGTTFLPPIGHLQIDGDYRESWQPQPMPLKAIKRAHDIARKVTDNLGGFGVFGVELFVRGEEVWFSEVSPRPHDTGMVTMISQSLSQFALHVRAILGFALPSIRQLGPSASVAVLANGNGADIRWSIADDALATSDVDVRFFGKPEVRGKRRVGVVLARAESIDAARDKARALSGELKIEVR